MLIQRKIHERNKHVNDPDLACGTIGVSGALGSDSPIYKTIIAGPFQSYVSWVKELLKLAKSMSDDSVDP